VPDSGPNWLPYAVSVLGPILTLVVSRSLSAIGASYRAKAELKRQRAERLRKDADPNNDAHADRLEEEAAADAAAGAALDKLGNGR
jgi:hypothetical protein